MVDPHATQADALAAALESQRKAPDRFWGTVRSVNSDGTVSVESGLGYRTSVRCLRSYVPRAQGDCVLVVLTDVGPVVMDVIDSPTAAGDVVTVSDVDAPAGQGWDEISTVWAKGGALWVKRLVAAPPPTGGTVSQVATALMTYRGGAIQGSGVAAQGERYGWMQTGLATFGSWAALASETATGGTLTIHRTAYVPEQAYGSVTAWARKCVASGQPATPPALPPEGVSVAAALNETQSVPLPAAWCQDFCTGAATAVAFYSVTAGDTIEIDSVTLAINY